MKCVQSERYRHDNDVVLVGAFIVNFEYISHPFFSVSIVDFEQLNVSPVYICLVTLS